MTALLLIWFVILLPLLWLSGGQWLRWPRRQSVLRLRILASLGALAVDGRAAAARTWRQVDMAEEAYRRRM